MSERLGPGSHEPTSIVQNATSGDDVMDCDNPLDAHRHGEKSSASDRVSLCDEVASGSPALSHQCGESSPASRDECVRQALRIMVVGDSISHGAEGDYTWRYRIWQWFKSEEVHAIFVGPYRGTQPNSKLTTQSPLAVKVPACLSSISTTRGGYSRDINDDWDSNHFSLWGRQAAQAQSLVEDVVAEYQPDLLLIELGFNDMGWFVSGPEGTLDSMSKVIANARRSKSDLQFAVANVPQRTYIKGREDLIANTIEYNLLLAKAVPAWSKKESPVHLVKLCENYGCGTDSCPAGHDGLHPNALGEFQIAQAFSHTLVTEFDLGSKSLRIPRDIPKRPTPVPDHFQVTSAPSGIIVTWESVYGAYSYDVRSRLAGTEWNQANVVVNRVENSWVSDGQVWEYQVRTNNGEHVGISDWTGIESAVAHPETAPGPSKTTVTATSDGFRINWEKPVGPYTETIDGYQLITHDTDTPGAFPISQREVGCEAEIRRLSRGTHYSVAVSSCNAAGTGMPAFASSLTPGYGRPPEPSNLQVKNIDPTTVELNWSGSVAAAGYRVWLRDIHGGEIQPDRESVTTDTTYGITFLFPGTWNYEFCVTAINGSLESERSNFVSPARWPDY